MTGANTITPVKSPPDPSFRLVTLGRAVLLGPGDVVVLPAGKPLALLTYLRSSPGYTATREQLIDLLWADSDPAHGRQSLRQTLTRLRQALGNHVLAAEQEEVALATTFFHDREAFLQAIEANDLKAALRRYGGSFFPEFGTSGSTRFEHWADGERSHLRGLFLRAGEIAGRRALATDPREALALARRLHQEDPDSEALHRLLLQSALAAREVVLATTEATALETQLHQAGRSPEPATTTLIRLVRQEGTDEPGSPSAMAELVGREKEFAALLAAWDEATRGQSRVVHIEARAGLGKSRLQSDLAFRLRANGFPVVQVRAHPGEHELSGSLAADAVRALAELPGTAGVGPGFVPALISLYPPLATRFPHAKAAAPVPGLLHQQGVALAELVTAIAEERPLAVLVDDLHWMDPASRQILASAANRLGSARILLITAARPGDGGAALVPGTLTCRLNPLSVEDCEAFVASVASPPDAEWTRRIAEVLWRMSHGSPLLATEGLQLALERDDLAVTDGAWRVEDLDAVVQRLGSYDPLLDRLQSLTDDERRLLLTLSVAGWPLPPAALEDDVPGATPARSRLANLEARGHAAQVGTAWTIGHDEMGAAMLAQSSAAEIEACHRVLGCRLAKGLAPSAQLQRAARHLVLGNAEEKLGGIARRWCTVKRQEGDTRPVNELINDLLGEELGTRDRIDTLRRDLPIAIRFGKSRALVAAGLILTAGLLASILRQGKAEPPPPEATLLYVVRDHDTAYQSLFRLGIREDRWRPDDSLTASQGELVGRWREGSDPSPTPAPRPGGGAIVAPRIVADSGQVDLFLGTFDGQSRRLTATPGDDIDPSWSPGRQIVFATARWSPRGDDNLDIGVLDPATGAVRQLTRGPDHDRSPFWSPDGTRIVFVRRPVAGESQLCWTTLEGIVTCRSAPGSPFVLTGWRDAESVVAMTDYKHWLAVAIDSGTTTPLMPDYAVGFAALSGDGKWMAAEIRLVRNAEPQLIVFPLARPDHRITLALGARMGQTQVAWMTAVGSRAVHRLAIVPGSAPALMGISHRLRVEATDSSGRSLTVPAAVLRWWVDDSAMATIDSVSGILTPRRIGLVGVHVTAGGWREASQVIAIKPNTVTSLIREDWADRGLLAWRSLGNPAPVVTKHADGTPVLAVNGDGSFDSGVLSIAGINPRHGLGAEFLVSTPIGRDKWQRLRLSLEGGATIAPSGMATGRVACSFQIPSGEGEDNKGQMGFGGDNGAALFPAPREVRSGAWYRVRLQVFPDGSCGVAVNGRAIWRSNRGAVLDSALQTQLSGQSVGTMIAVAAIERWQGVRVDIDWNGLRTPP